MHARLREPGKPDGRASPEPDGRANPARSVAEGSAFVVGINGFDDLAAAIVRTSCD
jgi:hypothetical protein